VIWTVEYLRKAPLREIESAARGAGLYVNTYYDGSLYVETVFGTDFSRWVDSAWGQIGITSWDREDKSLFPRIIEVTRWSLVVERPDQNITLQCDLENGTLSQGQLDEWHQSLLAKLEKQQSWMN
jgi:hypothetical protein